MFVIGYIFIALEHQTGINKTAIALLLGILLWVMYIFSGPQIIVGADPAAFQNFIHQHPAYEHLSPLAQVREYILNWEIIDHLGNISEILFYLIGALTIVETIDVHQGFDGITRSVKTKNKKKFFSIDRMEINALPELNNKNNDNLVENYQNFYFENDYSQDVIKNTKGIILLHNSWTPQPFLQMNEEEFLSRNNTLSNVLKTVLSMEKF